MRSSMMGFEVQKRSLQMAQKSLDIVGHNMGNASKVGYTRQRVDTASLHISASAYWQTKLSRLSLAGQGVGAYGVSQIRDPYLDKRYRDIIPQTAEYDTKVKLMTELETTLDNIDNFGLLSAFHELKSSLQQVSLERPDAREMASIVRNQVSNICSMLRSYDNDLSRLLENNLVNLSDSVSGANAIIDKIVSYNKSITSEYISDAGRIINGQGVSAYGPLELLDERNLLLDELAQYGNIEVFQNANGSVRVTLAGKTVVDDEAYEKLTLKNYDDYNAAVIVFSDGEIFSPKFGDIKAYMDIVNGNGPYSVGTYQSSEFGIPYYKQALDAFADGFASLMNGVNKGFVEYADTWDRNLIWAGYEYNTDGTNRLDKDGNFVRARIGASNIRVSDEWMNEALMIAETFTPTSIATFRQGAVYSYGDVFMDPDSKNYYIVKAAGGYTSTNVRDDLSAGNIEWIKIYNDKEKIPNYSSTKADYVTGNKFFDQTTGIYYEVMSNNFVPPMKIADALENGDLKTLGVKEGVWSKPNLDGANLHRFVEALESETPWGRAMDFYGSAFGYLEFLSNRLGQDIDHTDSMLSVALDTVNTILDNRDAISAVDDTEEGINMLTYQKWFNASSRIMTAMDEALDQVINRMGRVGL